MSKIGRMPVEVPSNVQVNKKGNEVTVRGPKGEVSYKFHPNMTITYEDDVLTVTRPNDTTQNKAVHGLTRSLLANMVEGVTQGYQKRLVINGVGYRAEQKGESITLQVGFSHPVTITPPEGINITVENAGRNIVVEGADKQLVGEVAARIRAVKEPEPYKGKGIAYEGEVIRRKAGKAGIR